MYIGLHVEYPLFLSDFNGTWPFWLYFMKINPVGAKLFHVEGRMDRHDEANNCFSQFCERT